MGTTIDPTCSMIEAAESFADECECSFRAADVPRLEAEIDVLFSEFFIGWSRTAKYEDSP
jgi:hypothetical protein